MYFESLGFVRLMENIEVSCALLTPAAFKTHRFADVEVHVDFGGRIFKFYFECLCSDTLTPHHVTTFYLFYFRHQQVLKQNLQRK